MLTECNNKQKPRAIVEGLIELFGENDIKLLIKTGAIKDNIALAYQVYSLYSELKIPEKVIKYEKVAKKLNISERTVRRLLRQ